MADWNAKDSSAGIVSANAGSPDAPSTQHTVTSEPADLGAALVARVTTTYRLRGFYATNGQFEYWSSSSINASPPSGHTLTDVTVTGTYTV